MKNIYLVGFMGTGKTAVAKLLAQRLKGIFVDMDAWIEQQEKTAISEIFQNKGEAYFRRLEQDLVAELAQKEGLVVACGGGTFAAQGNINRLKESGIVVCLVSTPEVILKRTQKYSHRPLLNVADPLARIEELLKKREPFYAQAHMTIDDDKLTVEETVDEILKRISGTKAKT